MKTKIDDNVVNNDIFLSILKEVEAIQSNLEDEKLLNEKTKSILQGARFISSELHSELKDLIIDISYSYHKNKSNKKSLVSNLKDKIKQHMN